MKISLISSTWLDFPSKEGSAVIVYFVGCGHNCKGCQNAEYQDYGWKTKEDDFLTTVNNIMTYCIRQHTKKVVFSGGDPMFSKNRKEVSELAEWLEKSGCEVCIYTGYTMEAVKKLIDEVKDIPEKNLNGLNSVSYWKTGKYNERTKEKEWGKTEEGMKLASRGQRFYKGFNLISDENYLKWED